MSEIRAVYTYPNFTTPFRKKGFTFTIQILIFKKIGKAIFNLERREGIQKWKK